MAGNRIKVEFSAHQPALVLPRMQRQESAVQILDRKVVNRPARNMLKMALHNVRNVVRIGHAFDGDSDSDDGKPKREPGSQKRWSDPSVCGRLEQYSSVFGGPTNQEMAYARSPAKWYIERAQEASRNQRLIQLAVPVVKPSDAPVGPGDYDTEQALSFPSVSFRATLKTQQRRRLERGPKLPPLQVNPVRRRAGSLGRSARADPGPGEYSLPEQRARIGVKFGQASPRRPVLLLNWMD